MYCFYTPMHCLIPPPEMCTQFGDPACISHRVCLSVSRVVYGFIQMCLGTSVPWQLVELSDVPIIPSNSELPPWKCFGVCEYVSRSVMSDSLWTQDYGRPGSSVRGIFQARILEWVAISFYRRSSQNRDQTQVSHIARRFFAFWATKEAQKCFRKVSKVCSWVWALSRGGPPCAAFLTEKKRWQHSSRRGSSSISVNRVQWACFISLCKMQI